MAEKKQYSGGAGTPLQYPRASAQRQRQTDSHQYDYADENPNAWTVEKTPNSVVRYDRPPRRETNLLPDPKKTRVIPQRQGRFTLARFLVILGLFLFVLAFAIVIFNGISNWWQLHTDDVTYGRPRTFQIDQYVGHGDSQAHPNHFIAVNLHGIVEVIEINTQDVKRDHAYFITTTSNALNPITLSFPTVDGKQYMYVSIGEQSSAYIVAMMNDGKAFIGAQH